MKSVYCEVRTGSLNIVVCTGASRCLLSDKYETDKYNVGREYSCWMLNCWCITWPVGFKKLTCLPKQDTAPFLVKFNRKKNLIFVSHIILYLPNLLFPSGGPTKPLYSMYLSYLSSVLNTPLIPCSLISAS